MSTSVMIGEEGAIVRVVAYAPHAVSGRPDVLRAYADVEGVTAAYKAVTLAAPFAHPGGILWVATYPIVGNNVTLRQHQFGYDGVRPGTLVNAAQASVLADGAWYVYPIPNPPPNPMPKTLFVNGGGTQQNGAICAVQMEVPA
jgi:hypothetical protein